MRARPPSFYALESERIAKEAQVRTSHRPLACPWGERGMAADWSWRLGAWDELDVNERLGEKLSTATPRMTSQAEYLSFKQHSELHRSSSDRRQRKVAASLVLLRHGYSVR